MLTTIPPMHAKTYPWAQNSRDLVGVVGNELDRSRPQLVLITWSSLWVGSNIPSRQSCHVATVISRKTDLRYYHRRGRETVFFCDEVAEWSRRWTANPLCSARVGSNPTPVAKHAVQSATVSLQSTDFFTHCESG